MRKERERSRGGLYIIEYISSSEVWCILHYWDMVAWMKLLCAARVIEEAVIIAAWCERGSVFP